MMLFWISIGVVLAIQIAVFLDLDFGFKSLALIVAGGIAGPLLVGWWLLAKDKADEREEAEWRGSSESNSKGLKS